MNICNFRYCHEFSVINIAEMEIEVRNEDFRSLSVCLMTFNGIKPYYKAVVENLLHV